MDRQQVFEYAWQKYGTEPEFPWGDWNAVLRHSDNGKWYGVVLEAGLDKLGLEGDEKIDVLNVKCAPLEVVSLKEKEGFLPAYHMNKEKWISIRLDGTASEAEIKDLIDLSFELTGGKK